MEGGRTPALAVGEADASWELIRDKVIEERFGPTVVPVPFLEDAASYDLLTVLIKKPQLGQPRWRRPHCLVPVGPLENLLLEGTPIQGLAHCTREYHARVRGESRYEETRLVEGTLRNIRLALGGVHKKVAFLALRPGTVALRPDLPWLHAQSSVYVVYEVFYCSSLLLSVTQGDQHRSFLQEQPTPVAFSCLKFALNGKGVLGPQKPMGHRLPAKATWVRMAVLEPPPPRLPPEPHLPIERATTQRKRWRPLGRPSQVLADLPFLGPCQGKRPTKLKAAALLCPKERLTLEMPPNRPRRRRLRKWPFKRPPPRIGASSAHLAEAERHSMSLPLLESATAECDTDE